MQEKHYKLILIIALLACIFPVFMAFDIYQKIKQSDVVYSIPGTTENTYYSYVLELDNRLADMHTYSILNIATYIVLLLLIVYNTNRAFFAEKDLESQRKKLQDIEVK